MLGDASKPEHCNIVLKFSADFKLQRCIVPIDRLTHWDGHPVRKFQGNTLTSCFSRPSGFNQGYHGNPYLCTMDMLYKGGDGDRAVRKTLETMNESRKEGDVIHECTVSYTNAENVTKKFKISYVYKNHHFMADWSASYKVLGCQSSNAAVPIYHIAKIDLSKDSIANGRIIQPTSHMADNCLKDRLGNWLPFVTNMTDEDWADPEKLKMKHGNVFLSLVTPGIRKEINEFLSGKVEEWANTKFKDASAWSWDDKKAFLKGIADGLYVFF